MGCLHEADQIPSVFNKFSIYLHFSAMAFWEVVVLRRRFFDPEEPFLRLWNKIFLVLSMFALTLDLLFFYDLGIDNHRKCLWLDVNLERVVIILRSMVDSVLAIRLIFRFRTRVPVLSTTQVSSTVGIKDFREIARRYIFKFFVIDILSTLPLPQVAILLIIPNMEGARVMNAKNLLKYIVILQLVPKCFRVNELYKETFRGSKNHRRFARFTLLLYFCAGHGVGGIWYLCSIERQMDCWQAACARNASCNSETLYCSEYFGNEAGTKDRSFMDYACPADPEGRPPFDFGLFINAINSGILESTSLLQKLLYCSWWALQNLSTLGQNLKTSTNPLEICFALGIFIGGLVLFSLVIGVIQATMLSSTVRAEERRMKWQDVERWMDTYNFPPTLKKRVRRHEQYEWRKTKGLDVEHLLHNFPKPLRSDIKRHLSRNLLLKVPMFEKMDPKLLDALCDCMKPVHCVEESYIVREGDPVDEMLFIMQGKLLTSTTNGGRTGFLNSEHLKAGDFCGEELLTWALDPNSPSNLPISTRTVQTLTEVEGFAIMADDLKFVASQFRQIRSKQLRHTFRFYSQQWRTWAACFIQSAWRRYVKRKLEENLLEEENRLRDVLAKMRGRSPTLGATIYASRFATNALRILRNTGANNERLLERVQPMPLQKPAEPDFAFEER